jgi:Fur family transcriptional regulator, peroxide stress response regulator
MRDRAKDDDRIEALRRTLHSRGLVLTPQRRAIFRAVLDVGEHPTADRVHAALKRRRIRVSRATVFRNLEALAGMGAITKACHPGSSVRYDGRTDRHHHLVCTRCDRIVDFADASLDALPVPDTAAFGFRVNELRVQLRGTCKQCREQEEKA